MNGNLIKQVTNGNYEVKNFIGWNPDTNEFFRDFSHYLRLKA